MGAAAERLTAHEGAGLPTPVINTLPSSVHFSPELYRR
jgi:hypothetical protein